MAIGIRILSDNLSGLTTNVTFLPQSGGTISLGTQVFPFNYISDYVYGTYNCYVPTYGYTYSLDVLGPTPTPTVTSTSTPTNTPTPTSTPEPLTLTLFADYTPGSIISSYTLLLNHSYSEEINVTFENILNVYSGDPITIFTGVTINLGELSGQTIVTINEDYNNYNGNPYFSQLSGTPSGSTYEIVIVNPNPTSTPTPTLTNTPTTTSTPTPTLTNTPTTTSTNTPSPTEPIRYEFDTICHSEFNSGSVCECPQVATIWGNNPVFSASTAFFSDPSGPNTGNPGGWYLIDGIEYELSNDCGIGCTTGATIVATSVCPVTLTPTPTNTETPTSTPTPTTTETPTPTTTPTNTETPTQTPTNTETPTQTPTETPGVWISMGNFNYSSISTGDACSTDITIPIWRFNKLQDFRYSGNTFSDVIPDGWVKVNSSDLWVLVNSEVVNFATCPTPTPTQTTTNTETPTPTPTPTPTTPLTLYYNTTPICDTNNPFNNVVLDNDFCSSTTITSTTTLPDGNYWLTDGGTRRDINASSGSYTFIGTCVACA